MDKFTINRTINKNEEIENKQFHENLKERNIDLR